MIKPKPLLLLDEPTASLDAAKAYTFAYLGYDENTTVPDVYTDEEVGEYISFGKFVD